MKKIISLFVMITLLICLPWAAWAQEPAPPAQESNKISLDIKGMDIVDVLKILSTRGNLNIVAGKNVKGGVTLFLKDVDVMDAFDIVLVTNGLAYETRGNIINVMTDKDYELLYGERSYDKRDIKIVRLKYAKAIEAGKSVSEMRSKIGKVVVDEGSNTIVLIDVAYKIEEMLRLIESMDTPTITKTFIVNYAKAEDLEEKIKDSLTKNVGEIKIDERMNKLMVTDTPEKLAYIERIISDFDERDKVVLIETKIVQITLSEDRAYGINWNNVFSGIDTIVNSDLAINLTGASPATTFTYTRAHGATEYGDQVILRLLDSLGKTNVLSTPRITVANNQEAKVLVGERQAFITSTVTQNDSTTSTADNVQFIDVGVRLSVTPTITDDGYISMKIRPEVSSVTDTVTLGSASEPRAHIPIVSTAEAETQLLVKDGMTIIMAGLMKDERIDNSEKIPGLGDIPFLGNFFKTKSKGTTKTELVVFLTPHIIEPSESMSEQAEGYLSEHKKMGLGPKQKKQRTEKYSAQEMDYSSEGYQDPDSYEYEQDLECEDFSQGDLSLNPEYPFPQNFGEYCAYISNKIDDAIQKNNSGRLTEQEINLSFVLNSDGSLREGPDVLTPVDQRVEALLIYSVEQALPFYPFPDDYQRSREAFKVTVSFEDND